MTTPICPAVINDEAAVFVHHYKHLGSVINGFLTFLIQVEAASWEKEALWLGVVW